MTKLQHTIYCLLVISVSLGINLSSIQAQESAKTKDLLSQVATDESTLQYVNLKKTKYIKKELALKKAKGLYCLNEKNTFINKKTETDELGWTHHRVQQTYKNIPIEGANYILHERNGFVEKMNGSLVKNIKQSAIPTISDAEALQILLNRVGAKKYAWEDEDMESMLKEIKQDSKASYCPNGELVFVSPNFDNNPENQRLAYKIDVFSLDPYDRHYYYVDANTGETITKITRIHENDATGTAMTNYYGTQEIKTQLCNGYYRLREFERKNGIETFTAINAEGHPTINISDEDNNWTSNDTKTGCEAHWCSEKTYDYFKEIHGRKSFDNNGAKVQSWVNYGIDVVNAFWNGSYLTYGDGNGQSYGPLTSLDIVGHEFAHAITERTAGLIYAFEPGALNESFSDIFGTMVEAYAEPDPNEIDWLLGEDAALVGNGFRSMSNPKSKGHPDTYKGDFWYNGAGDYGGVHINSGVQNYWFYLLSEGGIGINDHDEAYDVEGIGMEKAAKIAYRNLTKYLIQNSTYISAKLGSIEAAKDLYGASSNEVQQVKNAWDAVGVGTESTTPNGVLKLTQPNGGQAWLIGSTYQIKWTSTGTVGPSVKLEYSVNGGANWQTFSHSTANDGLYIWSVPYAASTVAKIKITSTANISIYDESDDYFTIKTLFSAIPPSSSSNCDAESIDLGPDVYLTNGNTIVLDSESEGMLLYLWDFEGDLVGNSSTLAVNDTGLYILAVIDSCGNAGTDSIYVLNPPSGDYNVWPGDMDFNGIVDHRDLPRFGPHMGDTSYAHIRENQDVDWYPHPAADWDDVQYDGVNLKHLDADGNGIIDLNDAEAVYANYDEIHNESPYSPPAFASVSSPFQIYLEPSITPAVSGASNEMIVNLVLENESENDVTFYGGYFSILYYASSDLISNIRLEFNDSWLGTEQELYYIAKNNVLGKRINVGITRLDRANKVGSGVIGQLIFDIDQAGFTSNDFLDFEVTDIFIQNSQNIQLPIGAQTTSFSFNNADCPTDLEIDSGTSLSGTYQVSNNISTIGPVAINGCQQVIFKSNEVELNPNFSVAYGANFSIELDPCNFNIQPRSESDEIMSGKAFEYLVNEEELVLNFDLQQSSDLIFELIDFSGNTMSKTDLGHFSKGKQQLSINKSDLAIGSFVGGLIYNGERYYFVINN